MVTGTIQANALALLFFRPIRWIKGMFQKHSEGGWWLLPPLFCTSQMYTSHFRWTSHLHPISHEHFHWVKNASYYHVLSSLLLNIFQSWSKCCVPPFLVKMSCSPHRFRVPPGVILATSLTCSLLKKYSFFTWPFITLK